ncbi:hypothetical protein GCM10023201_38530 [Actinomycetospora corticicola]|uniref:Uncharacterized protein n=1 Tax=Actinomycetospora corticicola TaxID=663602 RepID=A0A7Y9DYV3_9PSEU|nr:XRE family transcriptional regulator [Actinomycetospora corticicola]NYD38043.1 hypothetical protein [Actinomycetospora corticicola]
MNNLAEVRRLLHWSQPRAIRELRRHAEARGIRLPGDASLKRNFPRWESGLVEPGEMYQDLFCATYRRTAAELGFAPARTVVTAQAEHLMAGLDLSRTAGAAAGGEYAARLEAVRALDRQLGAPAALEELRALSATVERLLKHAVLPKARRPMAAVLADAAALAGWQALDTGDLDQAWTLHLTAQQAAREADDLPALVHAMAQQAYVLLDVGRAGDALELAHVAQDQAASDVPPVLDAWLSAVVGEMAAAAGDQLGARRALDQAAAVVPSDSANADPLPYISLDASHLARWRGNVFARLGDHDATEDLMVALKGMDASFTRASASLRCDLATSMLAQHEHTEARKHATAGRTLARRAGSVRQRRRLEALQLSA